MSDWQQAQTALEAAREALEEAADVLEGLDGEMFSQVYDLAFAVPYVCQHCGQRGGH